MLTKVYFPTLCFFIGCFSSTCQQKENGEWHLTQALEQAQNYNSSESWDLEMLRLEIDTHNEYPSDLYPLTMSPFPTPDYSSPGNGNRGLRLKINGKHIIGHTALLRRGTYSEHLFKHPDDEFVSYFTILALDDQHGNPNPVVASSRNHPNYFAQGSLNTEGKNKVDWIAIQLADGNAYAVVNGRIFDLRVGRIIFAAPKMDGSIRFFQTEEQAMSPEELDQYLLKIKNDQTVADFFSEAGNI